MRVSMFVRDLSLGYLLMGSRSRSGSKVVLDAISCDNALLDCITLQSGKHKTIN
jgi:hypothetical protein